MQSDLGSHASRFRVQKKCFGVGDVYFVCRLVMCF